jgi:hypothetical protein
MAVAALILHRYDDAATLRFSFPKGAQDVVLVVVVDEATHQRVWVLKSETLGAVPPANLLPAESARERALEQDTLAHGANWIEILGSRTIRRANRKLETFEYGSIPPGFQQVLPSGKPPRLRSGTPYSVIAVGGVGVPVGMLTFTA